VGEGRDGKNWGSIPEDFCVFFCNDTGSTGARTWGVPVYPFRPNSDAGDNACENVFAGMTVGFAGMTVAVRTSGVTEKNARCGHFVLPARCKMHLARQA